MVHSYQSYVVFVSPDAALSRDGLAAELETHGIATRQGTHALHVLDCYRTRYSILPDDYPATLCADRHSLALPLYSRMNPGEQAFVIDTIGRLLQG